MTQKKVILIGGGMAGLTAAAYLIRAGLSVTIYEQQSQAGGYISTFQRKGFIFPAGPSSFGSNGVIFPILQELGLAEKQRFIPVYHQISWAQHDIPLRNPKQTREALANCFPVEKSALRLYFRWVEHGAAAFHDSLKSGMMFGRHVFKSLLLTSIQHPFFLWAAAVANRHTNRSLHEHYFQNGLLRQLLNQLGYPVMSGKNTLGMWASFYYDSWQPTGGMQAFADLFVHYIQEKGGELRFGTRIKRIRIENGQATGVELPNGEFIAADWIISAIDLKKTCTELLDVQFIPAAMSAKLNRAHASESVFSVYLGLENSSELTAVLQRFQESHVVFTCADGKYLQIVWLNKDDATVAPPGKQSLYLGFLSPYEDWQLLKDNHEAYLQQKAAYSHELIARAEEFLPGLQKHIEVIDAASPLTYERYTGNWHGSTAGWNWDPQYAPHFKFPEDLPIKNFYSIGHTVFNPGGVPTAMITAWYIAKNIIG